MWREETLSFWLEIGLFVIGALVLLNLPKIGNNPQSLYWRCAMAVGDLRANRLSVSLTGRRSQFGDVLRAEVDRIRRYPVGVDAGGAGIPLRRHLSRHFAEEWNQGSAPLPGTVKSAAAEA
jgi:hypothetical protein